jgi:hypothetical protein
MLPLVALILIVHDTVGLAGPQIAEARTTVNAILEQAHLQTDWHLCPAPNLGVDAGDPLCAAAAPDGAVVVRVVRATRAVPPETLGTARVDGANGFFATVFVDHVRALAAQARFDPGVLLGRAIAHEIGHLLMGTKAHASAGLMRGRWSVDQLQRDLAVDWTWSGQEIVLLTRGLEARARRIGKESRALAKVSTILAPQ